MKLQSYQKSKQDVLQWVKSVREIVDRNGDATGVQAIDGAIARFKQGKINITIMGKAKRGKSTLINALLMRKDDLIAPVDELPASSVITRFIRSEEECAFVHFRNKTEAVEITYHEIRQYVTEELNPENRKEVSFVEVLGKFSSLDKDVLLIDTPGAGSIHEHHDQILQDVIPSSDVVVFLVTAEMPIDQEELELLQSVGQADVRKLFFVMNKVDIAKPDEIDAAIAHNRKVLGMTPFAGADMHYNISAKLAFEGKWAESNIVPLIEGLDSFIQKEKGAILSETLCNTVKAAAKLTSEKLILEIASADRSVADLENDLKTLQQKKVEFDGKRKFAEKEFESAWRKALDAFDRELPSIENAILKKYHTKISDASSFALNTFQKQLPECVRILFEEEMAAPSRQLETSMRNACETLNQDLPKINLETLVDSSFFINHTGKGTLFGAVAGTSAAALGSTLGLAAAGSTVALSTTTTALVAPGIAGGVGAAASAIATYFGFGSVAAPIGTTIASVLAAPLATTVTATPILWATVLGPVGWTLAGIGAMTIPISWACSKNKQRDKMKAVGEEHIKKIIKNFSSVRIPSTRVIAKQIVEDLKIQQEREIAEIECKIRELIGSKPSLERMTMLKTDCQSMETLIQAGTQLNPVC